MANITVKTLVDKLLTSDATASGSIQDHKTALTNLGAVVTGGAATGLNMSTAKILGRTTATTGAVEEITVGSGLSLTGGILDKGATTVVGPTTADDNAIARFDTGTGKLIQNSLVTVSDAGAITTPQSTASVIPFYYADLASFPAATAANHGAIGHAHLENAMYYSHNSTWVKMLDTGTAVTIAQGGTNATTELNARKNILPSFTSAGNAGKVLAVKSDLSDVEFVAPTTGLPADGTVATLRAAKASGFNSEASTPSRMWRLKMKLQRDRMTAGGYVIGEKFRSIVLGDSVSCSIANQSTGFFGYGGVDLNIQGWTRTGANAGATTEANWTSGSLSLYDEWTKTPGGYVAYIDANYTNGSTLTLSNLTAPGGQVYVQFLSGTADTGYGTFKLEYQTNNFGVQGAWTPVTSNAVVSSGVTQSGGVVNTDNAGTQTFSQAIFNLPQIDRYNYRIVAVTGRSRICNVFLNAGGLVNTITNVNPLAKSGAIAINYSQGGKSLSNAFRLIPQSVLTSAFGFGDPHVIIYKSQNGWDLASYQSYWTTFAGRVMTAAPKALFIVCGSHPQGNLVSPGVYTSNTNLDPDQIAVDDYLRKWCVNTEGAIFIDVRQSFPEWKAAYDGDTTLAEDLWTAGSNGVHIYNGSIASPAGGEEYVRSLVWSAIYPIIQSNSIESNPNGTQRILPFVPTEIRLFDGAIDFNAPNRAGKLDIIVPPRYPGELMIRDFSEINYGGPSGIKKLSNDSASKNSLVLVNNNSDAVTFTNHSLGASLGAAFGITSSSSTNLVRSTGGFRFLQPSQVYGANEGMVIESRDTCYITQRFFGIDILGNDTTKANPLWSYYQDGRIEYEGQIYDATNGSSGAKTVFTHDEPATIKCGGSGYTTAPTVVIGTPWSANATYEKNQSIVNGSLHYRVVVPGTSGTVAFSTPVIGISSAVYTPSSTTIVITTNVAHTLAYSAATPITIIVAGLDYDTNYPNPNGTFVITATSTNTISYAALTASGSNVSWIGTNSGPTISIKATGGTAFFSAAGNLAIGTANVSAGGAVTGFAMSNNGTGYRNVTPPKITLTGGGGGSGASAVTTAVSGADNVASITLSARIHTPINSKAGDGVNSRVIGVIPSYLNDANITSATLGVSVGDVYYDESLQKVRVRIS